ncbi:MAG: DUF1849 family protein [Alphaproteobacteria bacterium]|nr:DUF1849 family protein [Alphaproteobacteria bacterium]
MSGRVLRIAVVTAALVMPATGPARPAGGGIDTVRIVPHSAIYSMSLSRIDLDSSVFDFSGGLKINLIEDCEAWHLSQETVIGFVNTLGQGTPTILSHTARESKDGSWLRFAAERTWGRDREAVTESHGGRVERRNGQLVATYDGHDTPVVLSEQTLFPVAHSRKLLEAAQRATRVFAAREFSGSERMESDVLVTAVIGNGTTGSNTPEGLDATVAEVLFSGTSWPVHLGYFSPDSRVDAPDYEVSMLLHESGAVSSLTLHYDALDIDLGLEEVSLNALPDCP